MMRILLLSLGPALIEVVSSALAGQGYEIQTEDHLSVEPKASFPNRQLLSERCYSGSSKPNFLG